MAIWVYLRFECAKPANIGPSRAVILEAIAKHGTILAAAEALDLTYRQTWAVLKIVNREFGDLVVVKRGRHGGGVSLTEKGVKLLERYRKVEREFYKVFAKDIRYIEKLAGEDPKTPMNVPKWARLDAPVVTPRSKESIVESRKERGHAGDSSRTRAKSKSGPASRKG
jgi:molybdate transport system regulatory protein